MFAFDSPELCNQARITKTVPLTIECEPHPWHYAVAFRKRSDFNGPFFLDDYCAARKIDRIDFLKIDTQGYESRVLAGAGRVLAAHAIGLIRAAAIFAAPGLLG